MMKYITSLISLLFATVSVFAQESSEFTISGKFTTSYYDGLKVYLNELDYKETNSVFKRDSTTIEGNQFTFKGTLEKPISLGYLTLQDNEDLTAIIILEKGNISLEMSEIPQMSGTVKNDELREFSNQQIKNNQELQNILDKAQNLHKAGTLDETTSNELEQIFVDQQNLMHSDVYDFVSRNILNELGEFFFTIYAANMKTTELERLYAAARPEFQQGTIIKALMNQYVWSLGNLREGQKMLGIDLKNLDGKIEDVAIHFGKGKVVLVDFWASWCQPCLKSMPTIVKLYDRYRDSGFEIVGISIDESESSWKSAIQRFRMEWPQYIDDGEQWKGAAAQQYNITRIPQTYLLDKEGKIVGHNLSGVALIEKIEELLGDK